MTISPILRQFQLRFQNRLQTAARVRVSKNTISRPYRRLDSLARLLEGKSTCAAVYYHAPSKTLWLSNNKIHDNSKATNDWSTYLHQVFSLISNENLEVENIINQLSDVLNTNISQEYRYDTGELGELDLKTWLSDLLNEMFSSGLTTKEWKLEKLKQLTETNSQYRNIQEKVIKKVFRLTRDFLKIRDFLLNPNSNSPLASGILSAIRGKRYNILHVDEKSVHAEMRVLTKLSQANPGDYVGISKLCCDHCALAMDAFGMQTRGVHGQRAEWPLPQFIANNNENFARYVGAEAYGYYNLLTPAEQKAAKEFISSKESNSNNENARHGRFMYADTSDNSDIAFGPAYSDEEAIAEIEELPLDQAWTVRNIQNFYADEILRLREIGLSFIGIIDLYESSLEKFTEMSGATFINFINEIVDYEDEGTLEIFHKLSDIFDQDTSLFYAVLQDEHELLKKYGLDEVWNKYTEKSEGQPRYNSDGEENDFYAMAADELSSENEWSYEDSDTDAESNSDFNDYSNDFAADTESEDGYTTDNEDNYPEPPTKLFSSLHINNS